MPTAAATISKLSRDHGERGHNMSDRLMNDEKLQRGQSLTSKNGAYTLTLQDDGNLVLTGAGQAVWATGTDGQNAERIEVQKDGNCVLYTRMSKRGDTDAHPNAGANSAGGFQRAGYAKQDDW